MNSYHVVLFWILNITFQNTLSCNKIGVQLHYSDNAFIPQVFGQDFRVAFLPSRRSNIFPLYFSLNSVECKQLCFALFVWLLLLTHNAIVTEGVYTHWNNFEKKNKIHKKKKKNAI